MARPSLEMVALSMSVAILSRECERGGSKGSTVLLPTGFTIDFCQSSGVTSCVLIFPWWGTHHLRAGHNASENVLDLER